MIQNEKTHWHQSLFYACSIASHIFRECIFCIEGNIECQKCSTDNIKHLYGTAYAERNCHEKCDGEQTLWESDCTDAG